MSDPTERRAARDHLVELAVTDLGIIEHARLLLDPGMTALTGETGAGKTLLIGAIELLLGARADPGLVRHGASEAVVEGRFQVDGREVVLTRVIPVDGRSRAYVDGRMATATALGETASSLIDLHGQHAHQSLLAAPVQRAALDRFGEVDLDPLLDARRARRATEARLAELGGDLGARARETDLLRFQVAELDGAGLEDPHEDDQLDDLEDQLARAVAHRAAAAEAMGALGDDGGAVDAVGLAVGALEGHRPYDDLLERLRGAQGELADLVAELRAAGESIEDDPERLEQIRARRHQLVELRRKYGSARRTDGAHGTGTLGDVIAYREASRHRLEELEGHDALAEELTAELSRLAQVEERAAAAVGSARRAAASPMAEAVEANLHDLAMPAARFAVEVGAADPGDEVVFRLAANPGVPSGALAKVASGGELARTMLALRLVLSAAPPVLVFDEVDAGIGGEAALAVGRALAALGTDHQVLVVTHLAQVAAYADAQVSVRKTEVGGATTATATAVRGDERIVELSRMLSGTPDSTTVHHAAEELLGHAAEQRGR